MSLRTCRAYEFIGEQQTSLTQTQVHFYAAVVVPRLHCEQTDYCTVLLQLIPWYLFQGKFPCWFLAPLTQFKFTTVCKIQKSKCKSSLPYFDPDFSKIASLVHLLLECHPLWKF